jgi:hypothetical protein
MGTKLGWVIIIPFLLAHPKDDEILATYNGDGIMFFLSRKQARLYRQKYLPHLKIVRARLTWG